MIKTEPYKQSVVKKIITYQNFTSQVHIPAKRFRKSKQKDSELFYVKLFSVTQFQMHTMLQMKTS